MPLTFRSSRFRYDGVAGEGRWCADPHEEGGGDGDICREEWPPDGGRRGGTAHLRRGLRAGRPGVPPPALSRRRRLRRRGGARFKEAPAKVCCRAIGGWIDQRLLGFGWTQHDLADRIGVDRSAVAKWTTGGAISLGHLVSVLLEFRGDFADLPLPARRELALEGYLAALSHVRARIDPAGGREPLDRERFWCLFHLFSEPYWERAIRRQDRELVKEEADRVLRRAGESLGARPRRVVGVEGLRRLVEEWTAAWVICLELLPGGWSIR